MEESQDTGGGDFYDRVYAAPRPELFFKSTAHRTVGHGQAVRIRKDSAWNVPEPELTLVMNSRARLVGFTAGNDMSSRDIEGDNPLYLPQAKVYNQCCGLGPWIDRGFDRGFGCRFGRGSVRACIGRCSDGWRRHSHGGRRAGSARPRRRARLGRGGLGHGVDATRRTGGQDYARVSAAFAVPRCGS